MTTDKEKSVTNKSVMSIPNVLKPFKFIVIGLAAVFIVLLIVICFLIATETGSRWLIQTIDSNIKQLNIAEIKGTFASQLYLQQLIYQDTDEFSVSVADMKLQWRATELLNGHLHISLLQVNGINVQGLPPASEETEPSSEIPVIPITINIDKLAINQLHWLRGDSSFDMEQLLLSAILENNTLTLSKLSIVMPELKVNANSKIKLQPDWPVTANMEWIYTFEKTAISGVLELNGTKERFDLTSVINGAVESTQKGYIKLTGDNPEFSLNGNWQKIQWPLSVEPQMSSQRGLFKLEGTVEQYQATLNADVEVENHPGFSVDLNGHGGLNKFDFDHLTLKPAQGQLDFTGQVSWSDAIQFVFAIVADQLDPSDFGTDIPGKLNLIAQSKGHIDGDKIQALLDIESLKGTIYDQPLNAKGAVKLSKQQIDIQQLEIAAGSNILRVSGLLSKLNSDLDLKISAPDLRTAWPTLAGNLNGSALIRGSLNQPIIKSKFKGQNLRYFGNRIASLSMDADYDHNSKQQSKLEISTRNIQLADTQIDHLTLKGQGSPGNHSALLKLRSSLTNLTIDALGKWNGKQWQGLVSQLDIDHPQLKKWQLALPAELTLTPEKDDLLITLKNSCLIQSDTQLCFSAKGRPDRKLEGQLRVSALPLTLMKPWLPKELTLTGLLSAQANVASIKKDLIAKIDINVADSLVKFKDLTEQTQHQLSVTPATLQMQYEQDKLVSHLQLGLGQQDIITAEVSAEKANKLGVRQLKGKVNAKIANMALVNRLVPQVSNLEGLFVADLNISGNTEQPAITGLAEWKNAEFEVQQLGTKLENINLIIHSTTENQNRLILKAALESGEGQLHGQGYIDLQADENYPLHFEIQGEKFSLSRLPEAEVIISPRLTIEKQKKLMSINGHINIDKAKVEIKTLPESAVSISEDEVIITADKPKQKKLATSPINTHVTIDFGDNSHFTGFGLETRLTGKLEYLTKKDKQRMQGRAVMKDATYRSYGQDLTIRKGEFIFNGPTDNPWLNVEAIRKAKTDEVTAVLSVTGLLKSPKTKIYSEPTLPESEALAYLITGSSTENMSKGEGNAVASAALSYGVGQLSWLSDKLGIDEFEFVESDKIENSAVRLGQYLNPDLYIGVTTGLFASSYAVDLRYRLTDHFSVNTRSGETQKIELKYQLETD